MKCKNHVIFDPDLNLYTIYNDCGCVVVNMKWSLKIYDKTRGNFAWSVYDMLMTYKYLFYN